MNLRTNAALVEEAAAAAESLKPQAVVLVALVSEFRIGIDKTLHVKKSAFKRA